MAKEKKSFFEKLTGTVKIASGIVSGADEMDDSKPEKKHLHVGKVHEKNPSNGHSNNKDDNDIWAADVEDSDAELTIDVYKTPEMIVVKSMIAGVRPEDLDINITRDMVTIRGKREEERVAREDDYFVKELYWGSFSRTISLPEEIDVDESEAIEKHGLLILRLPKLDKKKQSKLKVKTI